jgi:hypothetical protein
MVTLHRLRRYCAVRRAGPFEIVSPRALHTPVSTGAPWLLRALACSFALHLVVVGVVAALATADAPHATETIDIEVAPPPPIAEALPAERERARAPAPQAVPAATAPEPPAHDEPAATAIDAGVDAPRKRRRADAAVDARDEDAGVDAGVDAPLDGGSGSGGVAPSIPGDGGASDAPASDDGGTAQPMVATATADGGVGSAAFGSGAASGSGTENDLAVDGAPTTAGTAANLLAYFPEGHLITALVRFDRLRDTEWAAPTVALLRPLPDYHSLFGNRDVDLARALDMLVISSPRPRDATATTIVVHTRMSRPSMRDFLANHDTSIAWSSVRGGVVGKRSGKLAVGDARVLISPWQGWYLLAQPADLGDTLTPSSGEFATVEAKGTLPAWLSGIRDIEKESGDQARGPALVVTLASEKGRYHFPDFGLGVTSAPAPVRMSVAVELVKHGWLVRGNVKFGSEADAAEIVGTIADVQRRVANSHLLSLLLRRQHVLDALVGLSVQQNGDRVSYATSMSIADARIVLAAAGAQLDAYFRAK